MGNGTTTPQDHPAAEHPAADRPMTDRPAADLRPLAGFTVGVTAARRREELSGLLRRRGARVLEAPALRILPLADDTELRRATEHCLAAPPDYVVATTGVGWRGWMSAADGWGHGAALADACRRAVVLSRGPKATGAVRASGLGEAFAPPSESSQELLTWLLARGDLTGRRIAVQQHGLPLREFTEALRERGAEVIEIPVYRWAPPEDPEPVRRLVERTVRREVHALTFTSAPAVVALLDAADALGLRPELQEAMGADVLPVCVGPACSRPLEDLGIEVVRPERGRLGALVRVLTETLPERGRRLVETNGRRLVLQGSALLVDGEAIALAPIPAALLRTLADRPGWVVSRAELLRRVWAGTVADEHTVEAAVARLRGALGPYAGLVRTVPKRGYRLAVGP